MMTAITSKTLNLTLSIFAVVSLGFTGCFANRNPWEITHPASGTIEFKGKQIENAELTFFPTDANVPESVRPKAKSTAGGKFVLGTYSQADGAPVGKYKVTVVRNEVSVSKDTIVAKPNDLPNKYSSLNTTDIVVEVVEGKNELSTIVLN